MSTVNLPFTYQTGQVISAPNEMANLNAIVSVINGGIDNTNLSPSIAITDSHLNQITTASKVSGTALINLASIPSGAGVIPAANLTYQNISYPYVMVSEQQTQNTAGGTATSGSWITRVLNTTNIDTASISSLASNQLTLPAGTYLVHAASSFYNIDLVQIRLQNITSSTTLLTSMNGFSNNGAPSTPSVIIFGLIQLSSSSALTIQYQVSQTVATSGLGFACNFGTEVYTIAEFTKIL